MSSLVESGQEEKFQEKNSSDVDVDVDLRLPEQLDENRAKRRKSSKPQRVVYNIEVDETD